MVCTRTKDANDITLNSNSETTVVFQCSNQSLVGVLSAVTSARGYQISFITQLPPSTPTPTPLHHNNHSTLHSTHIEYHAYIQQDILYHLSYRRIHEFLVPCPNDGNVKFAISQLTYPCTYYQYLYKTWSNTLNKTN